MNEVRKGRKICRSRRTLTGLAERRFSSSPAKFLIPFTDGFARNRAREHCPPCSVLRNTRMPRWFMILMLPSGLAPQGGCPLDRTHLTTKLEALVNDLCFPKEYFSYGLCLNNCWNYVQLCDDGKNNNHLPAICPVSIICKDFVHIIEIL